VDERREEELSENRKRAKMDVLAVFIFFITCPLIVFQTFFTFVTLGNRIDAAIAFSTIMIFNILQAPLKQFPSSLTNIIQIFSSLKRIESFLLAA
jgi:ABC-type multidrug transport system fused ATPase/permease subunit